MYSRIISYDQMLKVSIYIAIKLPSFELRLQILNLAAKFAIHSLYYRVPTTNLRIYSVGKEELYQIAVI